MLDVPDYTSRVIARYTLACTTTQGQLNNTLWQALAAVLLTTQALQLCDIKKVPHAVAGKHQHAPRICDDFMIGFANYTSLACRKISKRS